MIYLLFLLSNPKPPSDEFRITSLRDSVFTVGYRKDEMRKDEKRTRHDARFDLWIISSTVRVPPSVDTHTESFRKKGVSLSKDGSDNPVFVCPKIVLSLSYVRGNWCRLPLITEHNYIWDGPRSQLNFTDFVLVSPSSLNNCGWHNHSFVPRKAPSSTRVQGEVTYTIYLRPKLRGR